LVRLLALIDAVQQCSWTVAQHHVTKLREEHKDLFELHGCGDVSVNANQLQPVSLDLRIALATRSRDHDCCCSWLRGLPAVQQCIEEILKKENDAALVKASQAGVDATTAAADAIESAWSLLFEAIRRAVLDQHEGAFLRSAHWYGRWQRVQAALRKYTKGSNNPSVCSAFKDLRQQLRDTVDACSVLEKHKPKQFDAAVLAELRRGLLVRMFTSWEAFVRGALSELATHIQALLPGGELVASWPAEALKSLAETAIKKLHAGQMPDILLEAWAEPGKAEQRRRGLIEDEMARALSDCDSPLLLASKGFSEGLGRLCGLRPSIGDVPDDVELASKVIAKLRAEKEKRWDGLRCKIAAGKQASKGPTLETMLHEEPLAFEKEISETVEGRLVLDWQKQLLSWPSLEYEASGLSLTCAALATMPVVNFYITAPAPNQKAETGHVKLISAQLCHDLLRLFYGVRCVFAHGTSERTLWNGAMAGLKDVFVKGGAHDLAGAFEPAPPGQKLDVRGWLEQLTLDIYKQQRRYKLTHNVLVNMKRLLRACGELCVVQARHACQASVGLTLWQDTVLVNAYSNTQHEQKSAPAAHKSAADMSSVMGAAGASAAPATK